MLLTGSFERTVDERNRIAVPKRMRELLLAQSAAIYLEMARCHVIAGDEVRGAAAAERGLAYCSAEQCRRLRAYLQD